MALDASEIREMSRISQKVSTLKGVERRKIILGFWHRLTVTADIISTVEFDHTGNYLATGDKGGRVVLFERNETVSLASCPC